MSPVQIVLHGNAKEEIANTMLWYEDRQEGLGETFLRAIARTFANLDSPLMYAEVEGLTPNTTARSAGVKGFPYRVIFTDLGDALLVVAVAHDRQRPRYWSNRL